MKSRNSSPEPIRFVFAWIPEGLSVLQTPAPFENLFLPPFLQQSLAPARISDAPTPWESQISEKEIPFGTVANLCCKTAWGNLNLNFEPSPDTMLRVYLSISEMNFPCTSREVSATLRQPGSILHEQPLARWTYKPPPLSPGTYHLFLKRGAEILAELVIELSDRP